MTSQNTIRRNEFNIENIHRIENRPGIYAWYWRPSFSKVELKNLQPNPESIAKYLHNKLLSKLSFPDYQVSICGQLMPEYSGNMQHSCISCEKLSSSIENLTNPDDFNKILPSLSYLLEHHAVPYFSAPIYVGMSKDLNRRISQHVSYMTRLENNAEAFENDEGDAKFAERIFQRKIDSADLIIETLYIDNSQLGISTDTDLTRLFEYILNRLYFPILGNN